MNSERKTLLARIFTKNKYDRRHFDYERDS